MFSPACQSMVPNHHFIICHFGCRYTYFFSSLLLSGGEAPSCAALLHSSCFIRGKMGVPSTSARHPSCASPTLLNVCKFPLPDLFGFFEPSHAPKTALFLFHASFCLCDGYSCLCFLIKDVPQQFLKQSPIFVLAHLHSAFPTPSSVTCCTGTCQHCMLHRGREISQREFSK